MPQTMQISWHQSRRYLARLHKRLTELKKTLATRKPELIGVTLPDEFPRLKDPDPIPPPEIPCLLLEPKSFDQKLFDQILAAIFLATAEALTRTRGARPKRRRRT